MRTLILAITVFSILFVFGCTSEKGTTSTVQPEASSPQPNAPAQPKEEPSATPPVPIQTYSCPDGGVVTDITKCAKQKCSDGTEYDACSQTKPKFCNSGVLADDTSKCGCPPGYELRDSSCVVNQVENLFNTYLAACPKIDDCNKISNNEKKELCFYNGGYGSLGDKSCCLSVSSQVKRDECILSSLTASLYFGEKNDYCQFLSNSSNKDQCYQTYSKWLGGANYCGYLSTYSQQQDCYFKYHVCDKIDDTAKRDDCYVK